MRLIATSTGRNFAYFKHAAPPGRPASLLPSLPQPMYYPQGHPAFAWATIVPIRLKSAQDPTEKKKNFIISVDTRFFPFKL